MTFYKYVELMKLRIGFFLALMALAGYLLVVDNFELSSVFFLITAFVLCSSGSSVFNHFYDRDIDRMMMRTQNRPLANGDLEYPQRIIFLACFLIFSGLGLALFTLNWIVVIHLVLGAFFYMFVYTVWLKRRHWINIVIGGAAGSFPVLAGAAAADPDSFLLPMLMAITLFLWTPSHFWALAIIIKEDYAKAGIPMLPVVVGNKICSKYMMVNTILLFLFSLSPFFLNELTLLYFLITFLFGARFIYLNWLLVLDSNKERARSMFVFSMVYLGGIFIAIFLDRNISSQINFF